MDPSKKQTTRITCSQHVTPYLRDEVAALGFEIQDEDHVGVHVGANLNDCMNLILNLRTALHVMWLLKRFRCSSPKDLYKHIASFPWEDLIANDSYFTVTSNVDNPKITNSMYPNLVVKDAIVDRITKQTGARPNSGSDRSTVVIHLYWKNDRAWVYLNTNGLRLANRGYRKIPHSAPMQETLAAAVLLAAGYDGTQAFINPMCGSGTLAIEAALIAAGRAPGLLRKNYSFMHTLLYNKDEWQTIRAQARKQSKAKNMPRIVASDNDDLAIEAAIKNARTAGVEQLIEFVRCDFVDTPMGGSGGDSEGEGGSGIVILNPEYGERMGEESELEPIYKRIGDYFKQHCAGWSGFVFTGSRSLSKCIGLSARSRTPFMNGKIECRLLGYELYSGTHEKQEK